MMLHKDTDQAQEVMALLNQLPLSLHTLEAKEGVAVVAFPQLDLPDHLDLMDNQVTMELLAIQEKKDLPELLLPLNVNSTQVAKNADKHKLAHQESQDQRDCREKLANQGRLRTADYEDLQDHQDQLGQPDTQEIQDSPVNQESQEQSVSYLRECSLYLKLKIRKFNGFKITCRIIAFNMRLIQDDAKLMVHAKNRILRKCYFLRVPLILHHSV